jgi:xanthine dehydrogenase accessory factor
VRELFEVLKKDSDALHRVMATVLESGKPSKTLIYGYNIVYCSGNKLFFQQNLDEIVDVRTTGVYEIGGREVYCEVLEELPELVVCGAGHVGAACIRAASYLDMHITCIDDRQDFADLAKEMGAHEVICGDYSDALDGISGGENVYFLAMSRAHAFDEECLEKILRKPFAYVGMLGAAGKINKIRADLAEKGIPAELFSKVHTPVGLDISANTPEEIAIAVMAEIISVKNTGRVVTKAFDHEQLDAISSDKGSPILATIIRKHMASPRDPGTKMVVTSDGQKWGTIGGGAAEAEAVRIARAHMNDSDFVTEIIKVGDEARAEDGMVCGGVIDVLFERIN